MATAGWSVLINTMLRSLSLSLSLSLHAIMCVHVCGGEGEGPNYLCTSTRSGVSSIMYMYVCTYTHVVMATDCLHTSIL